MARNPSRNLSPLTDPQPFGAFGLTPTPTALAAGVAEARRRQLALSRSAEGAAGALFVELLERRQLLSAAPTAAINLGTGDLVINGTKKADTIRVASKPGGLPEVTLNGAAVQYQQTLGDGSLIKIQSIHVFGLAGNDKITVTDAAGSFGEGVSVTVDGGKGNDAITGPQNTAATLTDKSGNNVLIGGSKDDTLIGGKGHDRLIGAGGNDTIVTGGGKDVYDQDTTGHDAVDASKSKGKAYASERAVPLLSTGTASDAAAAGGEQASPLITFGTRTGLTPRQVRNFYGFGNIDDPAYTNRGEGQAVAVVIPYDVKNIQTSLQTFNTEFGLPTINTSNGLLQFVPATGTTAPDDPDPIHGWEAEAATDLEWFHAIAPAAKIFLVQANSDLFADLQVAVDKAVDTLVSNNGGGVVLMTFGSQNGEINANTEANFNLSFSRDAARTVSFVTGAGDIAGQVSYPSASPFVLSVGGTSINRDAAGNITSGEVVWSGPNGVGTGGGATSFPAPAYQQGIAGIGANRTTPDVAYHSDQALGYAVYDQTIFGDVDGDGFFDNGWFPGGAGGTSVAAPQWAGLVTLANELRVNSGKGFIGSQLNSAIYDLGKNFPGRDYNDITAGASGGLNAGAGYDTATGWGSPKANFLIEDLSKIDLRQVNQGLKFEAEYILPVTQVGPLAGPGAGFFNGRGSISGDSAVQIILDPSTVTDVTPIATYPDPNADTSTTGAGGVQVLTTLQAVITSLNLNPATRNPRTGSFGGLGTATLIVSVAAPQLPTPGDPNGTPTPTPTPTPTTTPTPTPTPGAGQGTINPTPTTTGPVVTTFTQVLNLTISYTGKVTHDKRGVQHVKGVFINLGPDGKEAKEGLQVLFRGKFKA